MAPLGQMINRHWPVSQGLSGSAHPCMAEFSVPQLLGSLSRDCRGGDSATLLQSLETMAEPPQKENMRLPGTRSESDKYCLDDPVFRPPRDYLSFSTELLPREWAPSVEKTALWPLPLPPLPFSSLPGKFFL